ncbi:CAT RNA binding domain-containing protein, partial [Enterococcus faecalis]
MRIAKALNNNVVLSRTEQCEEIVYIGRGLA